MKDKKIHKRDGDSTKIEFVTTRCGDTSGKFSIKWHRVNCEICRSTPPKR